MQFTIKLNKKMKTGIKQVEPIQPIVHFKNKVFRFSNMKEKLVRRHDGIKVVILPILVPIYRMFHEGKWKYASESLSQLVHQNKN